MNPRQDKDLSQSVVKLALNQGISYWTILRAVGEVLQYKSHAFKVCQRFPEAVRTKRLKCTALILDLLTYGATVRLSFSDEQIVAEDEKLKRSNNLRLTKDSRGNARQQEPPLRMISRTSQWRRIVWSSTFFAKGKNITKEMRPLLSDGSYQCLRTRRKK